MIRENTILRDRYHLHQLVGRGGMADVYLATDLHRRARVAVKIMREDLAEDPDFLRRFAREAEALSRLDHPNIVRFYSFERQGATAFIVLDYVPGTTLRRYLIDNEGPLPLDKVTDILQQVGGALYYAHGEGFIHRDIKPGNVMLRDDGAALLADFGIAQAMESATVTTVAAGTPAYMSPEQILGKPLDVRTDIYSLGVMLYQVVVGHRPFSGDEAGLTEISTAGRLREAHLHLSPSNPCQLNPLVPTEIGEVLLRALAKEPALRWPDMLSFLQAWEKAIGADPMLLNSSLEPVTVVQHTSTPVRHTPPPVRPVVPPETGVTSGGRHWLPWIAMGVVIGVAVILFVMFGMLNGSREAESSGTATVISLRSTVVAEATFKAATIVQEQHQATEVVITTQTVTVDDQPVITMTPGNTATLRPWPTLAASSPLTATRIITETIVITETGGITTTMVITHTEIAEVPQGDSDNAMPTLIPTEAAPTATPIPPPPTRVFPIRTPTPPPVSSSVSGSIVLLGPPTGESISGDTVTFSWASDIELGPYQFYELVFYPVGTDAVITGFSPGNATKETQFSVNLADVDPDLPDLEPGDYFWGVLLVRDRPSEPFTRVQFLGGDRLFTYERPGGDGRPLDED